MTSNAFTEERLEVLFLLCNQAAISLENARLYKTLQNYTSILEEKVEERTIELEKSIKTIKQTQKQLIQSEKLAALGNLVAGVAHEINTPVGVSMTSASFLKDKTDDFIDKLDKNSPVGLANIDDVVNTIEFLINSNHITGEQITVDGGAVL